MKSIGQKLEKIEGLVGTKDLNPWEDEFVRNNLAKYRAAGNATSSLSGPVLDTIESIHDKHFA